MRVIAGEFRSRRLKSISGRATRPTPDRLRETLFDILGERVKGATFADVYAGTGAVGIEALSRGAAHAYFLECNRQAIETLRNNIAALGLEGRATIFAGAAFANLTRFDATLIFLDPPYNLEREYAAAMTLLGEMPPAMVIVQHSVRLALDESYGKLSRTRVVRQGDNALSFYLELHLEQTA